MNHNMTSISNFNKGINPQQFDQIVEAILAGKYSWACVLILRVAGYNPLHYIPYRTYNRLLKENSTTSRAQQKERETITITQTSADKKPETHVAASCLGKIKDLAYLEVVGKQKTENRGGNIEQGSSQEIQEYQPLKSESNAENTQDFSLEFCEAS
ncbi:HetP family heterocyst commitment protein [Nostoc sp. FACHB-152]|uniref:HetP family heterocyst commitment protein n=1 Tax=unclassified Nostoc TaxID=2593658 RepID=UPI00168224CA|nr:MULTISPECIES: HetP family heterocyst commitment protein [unclassified Nostoc]MBD2449106.1 HetP family heterocyst commitment protein [Nostoc sp. FACHB-152]MBD2472736.1 HetP family heterocyst commitment protein [Nostoc sp. FACHB-145]